MKSAVVIGMIVVGFAMLAGSSLWTTMFPATSSWTNEKSQRLSQVKDRITNLSFMLNGPQSHIHANPVTLKAEVDQLTAENEQLNSEFQAAYDRPNNISKILKWSGLSLAGIGVIGWYAINQSK